jgi:hypothetical protein
VVVELPARDPGVGVCEQRGVGRRQTKPEQGLLVFGRRQILVFDGLAGLPRHLLRELRHREGLVARELELLSNEPLGERRDGRRCVVRACCRGDLPILRGSEDNAMGEGGVEMLRVVLGVPAVAQEGVRDAGRRDDLLARLVLFG